MGAAIRRVDSCLVCNSQLQARTTASQLKHFLFSGRFLSSCRIAALRFVDAMAPELAETTGWA
jgi:hypothetical protein